MQPHIFWRRLPGKGRIGLNGNDFCGGKFHQKCYKIFALSNSFTIHLALLVHLVTDNLPAKSDGAPIMAGRPMINISIVCIILNLKTETWECSTWQDCWRATSDTVWQLEMEPLDFTFRSISTCFTAESGSEIYETETECTWFLFKINFYLFSSWKWKWNKWKWKWTRLTSLLNQF